MERTVDVEIAVIGGRDLINLHSLRPNPSYYVALSLNGETKRTQGGGKGSKTPKWDQKFVFSANLESSLRVDVSCIHGHAREDHLIGQDEIDLFALERNKDVEITLHHRAKKSKEDSMIVSGYITINIKVALPVVFRSEETKAGMRSLNQLYQMEKAVGMMTDSEIKQLSPAWTRLVGSLDVVASFAEKVSELDSRATVAVGAVSFMIQVLVKQVERDEKIEGLGTIMAGLYTYVRDGIEMDKILTYQKTLDKLLTQTTECAYFIADYRKVKLFTQRAVINIVSNADEMIVQFEAGFGELKISLILGSSLQSAVVAYRILQTVEKIEALIYFNNLPYLRNVGWDSSRTCLRGTRRTLVDDVIRWASSSADVGDVSNKRIFVLTGPRGCGKTALAHTIAQAFHEQQRLGASVFLQGPSASGANSQTVSSSIIYQLGGYNPAMKSRIVKKLMSDISLTSADIGQQFRHLLVGMVNSEVTVADTSLKMIGPTLIIIDDLHKILDKHEQNRILTAIADHFVRLPPNFRLLLTSQQGDMVADVLGRVAHHCEFRKINFDNPREEPPADYMTWSLEQLFAKIPELSQKHTLDELHRQLMERSNGIQVWVDTMVQFILFCQSDDDAPNASVPLQQIVASPAPLSKEDAMDNLYRVMCTSIPYPSNLVKDLLLYFLHSSGPVSLDAAHQAISMACSFDTNRDPLKCKILQMLQQFNLIVEKGRDESSGHILLVLNPAFSDFLTNERRSYGTTFFVNPGEVCQVATMRINTMIEQLVPYLHIALTSEDTSATENHKRIFPVPPETLKYACSTWISCVELCGAGCMSLSADYSSLLSVLEIFVADHIFDWMLYMGINGLASLTKTILSRLPNWLGKHVSPTSSHTFKLRQCLLFDDLHKILGHGIQMTSSVKMKSKPIDNQTCRTISVRGEYWDQEAYTCSIDPWSPPYPMDDTGAAPQFVANISYPGIFATTSESRSQCVLLTPKLPKVSSPTGLSKIRQVTINISLDLNAQFPGQFLGKEAGTSSTRQPRAATELGETRVYFDALIVRHLESNGKSLSGASYKDVRSYIDEALAYEGTSESSKIIASTVKNPDTNDGAWPIWRNGYHHPGVFSNVTTCRDFYYAHENEGFSKITPHVKFVDLLLPGDRIAVIFREETVAWYAKYDVKAEVEVLYVA